MAATDDGLSDRRVSRVVWLKLECGITWTVTS
jgi:hypothetical protein